MSQSLSVDSIVNVTINVSPQAPVARGFGTLMVLGLSAVLPTEERVRTYTNLDGVLVDFVDTTEEYKAARRYFGQKPAPRQLKIGRRYSAATAGHLRGGAATTTLASYTAVTDGGFDVVINGVNHPIADLNFSGAASLAAVAALIQTALNAALGGTTCVYTGGHFLITSPTTGTSSTVSYAVAATTGGPSADITGLLKLKQADGALSVSGLALETQTAALAASALFDADWFGLANVVTATDQDEQDSMAWTETQQRMFFFTTDDANAKLSAATSDLGYIAHAAGYVNTVPFYKSDDPYFGVGAAAKMFAVNFDQPNSMITLKFKQIAGLVAEPLSETERLALEAKKYNYYGDFGGFPMIAQGTVSSGRFADEVHGLFWLQSIMQNEVFTTMATSPTKLPQTNAGVTKLTQAADKALDRGRSAGLLASGFWQGDDVGEIKNGDFLENGYHVHAGLVEEMLTANKQAREAPPLTGIGIGAGALHSCALTFNFQR